MLARLHALSELTGLTESDLIRQCVNLYLPVLKRKLSPPAQSAESGENAKGQP
ncbi:MAG: hypothetical protein M5U12_17465 [Verrucomicrobia bacterium]|nr:hypothetical protein [Verrucomicrobiota bacterium]